MIAMRFKSYTFRHLLYLNYMKAFFFNYPVRFTKKFCISCTRLINYNIIKRSIFELTYFFLSYFALSYFSVIKIFTFSFKGYVFYRLQAVIACNEILQ